MLKSAPCCEKANAICEPPASITNIANMSGGGDSNLRNDATSDGVVVANPVIQAIALMGFATVAAS